MSAQQQDWTRLMLRLPPDMKAFLAAEAARNGSSQNSEIVRAIRERMGRMQDTKPAPQPD